MNPTLSQMVLPCAVFAFNRPAKLASILQALRGQGVEQLLIFIDGPRSAAELPKVEACRSLARQVNWAPVELHFRETNRGLPGLAENVSLVLEKYPWLVVVEDDCQPVPGFYRFMRQALEHYWDEKRVFSIGGYQPLPVEYFKDYPVDLVSCARFTCWGWAAWQDRWLEVQPLLEHYRELFDNLQRVPEIAGMDMPLVARAMASGKLRESWDIKVALASLALKKVNLLPARGLIQNIGLDRTGAHGGFISTLRDLRNQNRNLAVQAPQEPKWLEDVALDSDYAVALKDFVHRAQGNPLRRLWKRGQVALKRYVLPGGERYLELNLAGLPAENLKKRALLSYIVHPFSIPREDPRFVRHINIWHAQEMVRVLNRMGYLVDVIDYRDTRFNVQQEYDLFIGHGGVNFEILLRQLPEKAHKLYLSMGAYWKFHNEQEQARFDALRQRRGVDLPRDRYIQHSEEAALCLADGVIGIGNSFTRQTYAHLERVEMINGTSLHDDFFDWFSKDYAAGRGQFVFFSGGGNVHKGLDLLLEAFAGLEQHLWVVSTLDASFCKVYAHELQQLPNIHTLGWVQPRSVEFYRVMRRCNFCILPSCSEGQSQSVVEAMNQGVIPVVSRAAGLDVGSHGVFIEPCTVDEIRRLVQELAAFSEGRCREMSQQARVVVQQDFSEISFGRDLQAALERLLA